MRLLLLLTALAAGIALGGFVPQVPETIRRVLAEAGLPNLGELRANEKDEHGHSHGSHKGHGHGAGEKHEEGPEGVIKMPPDRIEAAKIELAAVDKGTLARRLTVPGTVTPDSDRMGRVAAKVVGTVAELRKRLGDTVQKGEVVAVLDSREVAEARSDLRGAQVNFDLQKVLFEREQSLWDKRISAEQQYLRARTAFSEAQLRVELAQQKLTALGVIEEPTGPGRQPGGGLQRYSLSAPISGRVVERRVDLGAPVGGEGQEKELYVIADLSTVWVELAVPTSDLSAVKEGQAVAISTGASGGQSKSSEGRIIFISPLLNQDTRSARVIAALYNADLSWRPGFYVTARITVEENPVDVSEPRTALQTIGGEQVVFVRTSDGFEKREVVVGKSDEQGIEVVFGLDPGESIAISNTFILKAELGKAEAEHVH